MSILDRPLSIPSDHPAGSLRRGLALTVTLALVALAILLPVMQSSDETAQGYRIRTLEQQRIDLEANIYGTEADIAQLGSLDRINSEGQTRLGMVPANQTLAVSVSVPRPLTHPLPNRYVQQAVPAPATRASVWQKVLHLLRLA